MVKHMISVCIFCFICATHSPCESHIISTDILTDIQHDPGIVELFKEKFKERHRNIMTSQIRQKRNTTETNSNSYVTKIFNKYGNGEVISLEGFGMLLNDLKAIVDEHKAGNESCETMPESPSAPINAHTFHDICPALLYPLLSKCAEGSHDVSEEAVHPAPLSIWLYSMGAVILISACGILSLLIIPVMQNRFYKPLIQFLVALAVGTLAGDALLHLLPHAMISHHEHHSHDHDNENMWKGFVAMMGLTFFFVMEKIILFAGKWRKAKQKPKALGRVKVVSDGVTDSKLGNDTQCMDKYSSYPYCYKDILKEQNAKYENSDRTVATNLELRPDSEASQPTIRKSRSPTCDKLVESNDTYENSNLADNHSEINRILPAFRTDEENITVILRQHESDHHGHSHKHGHVHSAPQNFSSVAWMVIMGDGLHNFTDGMAIGAAFSASGAAGGFSTTVAVLCHELPHELGDFAMLLKAGMSIKQALFYNLLSSVLCVFGNVFGVWLGNTEYASSWVFAAAAGMFIYIALVDMIPELSASHEDEGNLIQYLLHLSGLLMGFLIMTMIALYEHDLKNIFHDDRV